MSGPALVHFSPHPDDWIFFWGESAASAAEAGQRSIFIQITAGDAGRNDGWWEARERAALAAIGRDPASAPMRALMHGHAVAAWHRDHISAYFLRLPDGMPDGRGSPASGQESLSRLRDGGTPLRAIDGSAAYASWADLVATVAAIVAEGGADATLYATEYRPDRNPGDHADHIATADLVRALPGPPGARRWYTTYCSYYVPFDGDAAFFPAKARAWLAHRTVLADHLGPGARLAQLDGEWLAWAAHEHARSVAPRLPESPPRESTPWLDWRATIADDTPVRAVAPVIMIEGPGGKRIGHPLTGTELALDDAAVVVWGLLIAAPLSAADLAATLAEAFPGIPGSAHLATARSLLATLVAHRLVVPAAARLPE